MEAAVPFLDEAIQCCGKVFTGTIPLDNGGVTVTQLCATNLRNFVQRMRSTSS